MNYYREFTRSTGSGPPKQTEKYNSQHSLNNKNGFVSTSGNAKVSKAQPQQKLINSSNKHTALHRSKAIPVISLQHLNILEMM